MRVIEPARYQPPRHKRRVHKRYIVVPLAVLLALAAVNYLRPLPTPTATLTLSVPDGTSQPAIAWPSYGQASVAASGYGLLGTNGGQKPLATASIAKVILALCLLQKQPLKLGDNGPTYTIDSSDVALYQMYAAQDGSLLPVVQGEKLNEYQALEALMLPSANNIADSLVRWEFGSQAAYAAYANDFLVQHGLLQTHIGKDASGYDPSTTSTASDLTNLGLLALKSPVLMQIAGQRSTNLPVVGRVDNYDTILGINGINGLKTGNNETDLGAFLFTSTVHIGSKDVLLTGAVMDAPDLATALQSSAQLAASLQQGFEQVTVAASGQQVGAMKAIWGASVPLITDKALQVVRWKATPISETHKLNTGIHSGALGTLKVSAGRAESQSPVSLAHELPGPSFWWRLTRH